MSLLFKILDIVVMFVLITNFFSDKLDLIISASLVLLYCVDYGHNFLLC